MAPAKPLAMMWEEVTCCVCLDPFVEPVIIECGHSFCRGCISTVGKDGGSSCPLCRQKFLLRNIRPNWQLANMMDILRQMDQSTKEDMKGDQCRVHGEKLHLFCEEDGEALCWVCAQSRKHRDHSMIPTEEATHEHQEKFPVALQKLRREQELAEKLEVDTAEKRAAWKTKVETQKSRIHAEFVQQRNFLAEEEERQLQKLEKDETDEPRILGETEAQLDQKSQALQELISELERRSRGPVLELLQEKLPVALQKLRREQELAEKLEVDTAEKRAAWKTKVETQKSRIHAEFVQQRNFLAEEEERQLQKLEKDETDEPRILGETEAQLDQKSQALQELISELERRSRGPVLELLQEKFPVALQKLRRERELAEKLEVDTAEKRAAWKTKVETQKSRIHAEFVQQRNFLTEEEERQLQKLEKDETDEPRILGETEAQLDQRSQALQELISELERRSRGPVLELLQEKLPVALQKLRRERELAEKLEVDTAEKRGAWKTKVETQKSRIHAEFVQLRNFLAKEEERQLQKLEKDERDQPRILGETEAQLAQESQALQEPISELERRSRGPVLELLQEAKSILERSEAWNLKELGVASPDLRNEFRVPGLKKMLRTHGVHVTLDPDTASPWLILSEDKRLVKLGDTSQDLPENEERFDSYPMVLGAQVFYSGKLYWEVDVTGKEAWDLGVCRHSVKRKGQFMLSPENGFWTIWLWNKKKYEAVLPPRLPSTFRCLLAKLGSSWTMRTTPSPSTPSLTMAPSPTLSLNVPLLGLCGPSSILVSVT
ncbi:E3 ubiquitin-protein ligase TRIM21-like [Elephas maximus indicus]|uniref:E3 ubiquitin-protein ligase TRIM21-like n=1 Tax=Elephas maximus indicus TaxID=99487 RepID=UPI0021170D22|nr:E3 ubiquitin-protein ligase TRIM21-like [Elephas maximus indicus]